MSVITRHLMDNGHNVDVSRPFKIINIQYKPLLLCFLNPIITMTSFRFDIYIQKGSILLVAMVT